MKPLQPPHVREDAAAYLRGPLARHPTPCLVLLLRPSGCSGWSYDLQPVPEVPQGAIRATGDAPIYVRAEDLPLLSGTLIRLERQPLGVKVVFDNPQETGVCGCGASVALTRSGNNALAIDPD